MGEHGIILVEAVQLTRVLGKHFVVLLHEAAKAGKTSNQVSITISATARIRQANSPFRDHFGGGT
jgi:hypothetical protein